MIDLRKTHVVVRLYFSLAIPFLLVVSAARLLLSEQFLFLEYQRPGFPADVYGLTADDRIEYGAYAIDFLFNAEPIDYLGTLRLPWRKCWNAAAGAADCAVFSERELRHMADVKLTTSTTFLFAVICLVTGVVIAAASRRNERIRSDMLVGIRLGCKLTLLSVVFLAILSLASWDQAFDAFHELFFAEGTWRFPFSDSLIRLYPEQLFIDAALFVAAFASSGAAILLWLLSLCEGRVRTRIQPVHANGRPPAQ